MKIKTILAVLAVAASPMTAFASGGADIKYVGTVASRTDLESLQRGARLFVNHCLNCHSAQYVRYKTLTDLNLTEEQIKQNLMFGADKLGEQMKSSIKPSDAKEWFGAVPPDLSVMARSYTTEKLAGYLRSFYQDDKRPTGWNNLVSPNIGMPHVLAELSGPTKLVSKSFTADGKELKTDHDAEGKAMGEFIAAGSMASFEHHSTKVGGKTVNTYVVSTIANAGPGSMTPQQYDYAVADLVNFMDFIGEPHKAKRVQIGILMMFLLAFLLVTAYVLKKEYWRDVH